MNQVLETFIAIIVSIALGYTCFTITIDPHWGGFCSFSILSLYLLSKLLKINKYLEFIVAFAVSVALTVAFLIYKIKVTDAFKKSNVEVTNSYFNRFRENNTGNDALFFWAMFAASAITVLGILIAKNIYSKMKTTGGLQGETGPRGPRGDSGETSAFLNGTNQIVLNNIVRNINAQIEKHMKDSPKSIQYREGDDHLKNFYFKMNLKRIIYSQEFNKSYIDTLYSNTMKNLTVSNKKCARENVALQNTLDKLNFDVSKWVSFILSYTNGLKWLTSELPIERDWEFLYIKRDKRNGLPPNPIEQLRQGIPALEFSIEENKWNWGNCKV